MSTPVFQTTNKQIVPLGGGENESRVALPMASNLRLMAGQLVAACSQAAASDVQTFTTTGNPTTGGIVVGFNGQYTASIPYNATAAQFQAALEALPNIGTGNIACTGGPLHTTPIVATFQGALANLAEPVMTIYSSTLDAGATVAVAHTTTGVPYGRFDNFTNVYIPDPAAAPSVTANGAAGTFGADSKAIQCAWGNDLGMTRLSPPVNVTITAAQGFRQAAINAANTPDGAKYYYLFADGVHIATVNVTTPGPSGNVAQTDVNDYSGSTGIVAPRVNMTVGVVAILRYDVTTDERGRVTYSQGVKPQWGVGAPAAEGFMGGRFRLGDLLGYTTSILSHMGARFVKGTINDANAEVLIVA